MRIHPYRVLKRALVFFAILLVWRHTQGIVWMYCRLTELYYYGKHRIVCRQQQVMHRKSVELHPSTVQDIRISRYIIPRTKSIAFGKTFNIDESSENIIQNILRTQTFKRKPVELDSVDLLPDIVPVTGASSNHFRESIYHINITATHFPRIKIIYYDLGLEKSEIEQLKMLPFLEYRKFDFCRYPSHVLDLHNYAWKPLIIQELLAESDGVLWFDSSLLFYRSFTFLFERIVRYKSGFLFYIKTTEHSIMTATHPRMLEYFPMEKSYLTNDMRQSGGMIVFNTAEVQKHIMKWAVVCSLTADCIAPTGSTIKGCDFKVTPRHMYGGCHRYDQSLFAILVSNAYNYTEERYALNKEETLAVCRRFP